MRKPWTKSLRVEQILKKFGADLRDARLRRELSQEQIAERFNTTTSTIMKMEKGDPKTAIQIYALALHMYGKIDALEMLIDRTNDPLSLDLTDRKLPKRIRKSK